MTAALARRSGNARPCWTMAPPLEVWPKPKLTDRDDMIITYWKRVFDG